MIPLPSSYVPSPKAQLSDKVNFFQRVKSFLFTTMIEGMMQFLVFPIFKPMETKYKIRPDADVGEMIGKAEMHIIQLDFALEFANRLMPSKYLSNLINQSKSSETEYSSNPFYCLIPDYQ